MKRFFFTSILTCACCYLIWGSLESLMLLYSASRPFPPSAFLELLFSSLLLHGAFGALLGGAVGALHALLSSLKQPPFRQTTPERFALAISLFSIAFICILIPVYGFFRYGEAFDLQIVASRPARILFALATGAAISAVAAGTIVYLLSRLYDGFQGRFRIKHGGTAAAGVYIVVFVLGAWFGTEGVEHGGGTASKGGDSKRQVPGVVLITVDTLRADYLGCHGNALVKTPWMDLASREGARFSQASCPIPITGPSHISLMTSLAPRSHGSRVNGSPYAGVEPTLAELLKRHGYRTAAFIGGYPLKAYNCGLDRGIDVYDDSLGHLDLHAGLRIVQLLNRLHLVRGAVERNAEEVNKKALNWLENNCGDPFFLWIHYFDPHYKYAPPPPYDTLYKGKMGKDAAARQRELYAGEVSYTDARIGEVIGLLKRLNIYDQTLLIITADHGESLGEHDYYYDHTEYLYEPIVRIPLIMRHPPAIPKGVVVEEPARIVDIVPTILSIANIPTTPRMLGRSLVPLADGSAAAPASRPPALIETFSPESSVDRTALRTPGWKWIVSSDDQEELYNLVDDPGEKTNLAGRRDAKKRELKETLQAVLDSIPHSGNRDAELSIDPERLKKLKSLGYLK